MRRFSCFLAAVAVGAVFVVLPVTRGRRIHTNDEALQQCLSLNLGQNIKSLLFKVNRRDLDDAGVEYLALKRAA